MNWSLFQWSSMNFARWKEYRGIRQLHVQNNKNGWIV